MNNLLFTHTTRAFSARFVAVVTIVSLLLSAFPVAFFVANATVTPSSPYEGEILGKEKDGGTIQKIEICHSTASDSNPYTSTEVNISSFFSSGHDADFKDIIPPFDYNAGDGIVSFPGTNWDTEGQEIYFNGCDVPVITGSVSGAKYDDMDNDGSIDGDETLSGWTIRLYEVDGQDWTKIDETVTDGDGEYEFTDLPEGEYKVCEVMQDDWTQTFTTYEADNESPMSGEEGPKCQTVEINVDDETNTRNFGNYYEEPDAPVDFCDPAQKPGGVDIAQWHDENQFDGSSCFTYEEVAEQCGTFDVKFTSNETGLGFGFNYVLGSEVPENFEDGNSFPATFVEDENGGSVELTYYVVGQEEDYFVGSDVPNFWDGTGETVMVDTDCENDVPPIEIPEQCSVKVDEFSVPANSAAGANTNISLDAGLDYFAVVEGTYTFGAPKNNEERLADAEYSLDAGNTEWVKEFDNTRPDVLDLFIDGTNPDFGAFRSDHTYGTFLTGTGAASNFAIDDNPYNDNSGTLDVTIYECERPKPPVCEIGENLLKNGSFEEPEIKKDWIYTSIVDWIISAFTPEGGERDGELHNSWSGNEAADGDQYAELDSRESVKMSQTVSGLTKGATYELTWAFAPRHGISSEQNQLLVMVNTDEVASSGPATGSAGLEAGDWMYSKYQFVADGDEATISFADAGPSNSFGTFLDDTSLCFVSEPEQKKPQPYTCDAGMLFLDTETGDPDTMSLYTVDESDGLSTFWADFDIDLHSVMAIAADGTVFSIEEGTGNLVTLDNDGGDTTVIGNTGLDAEKPVAMEIAPDGTLYVMTQNSDKLYEVDMTDGSATELADLDLNVEGGDIVFDGGFIYFVKNTGEVYEIDPDNSYAEDLVGTLSVGNKRITSAATKDGVHYAYTRENSFHAFTLNPFVEGAAIDQTGPFAYGDGSYCPAKEIVEPEMCTVTAYSDTGTVVVESNMFAVETYEHGNWADEFESAEWIWTTEYVENPDERSTSTFKETFEVQNPSSAMLEVWADNWYKVYVNGELVADREGQNSYQDFQKKTYESEILDELISGENTLLIEVINEAQEGGNWASNPAGLLYKLTVEGDENSCELTTDTEKEEDKYLIDGFKRLYQDFEYSEVRLQEISLPIEQGLSGWTIELYDEEGTFITSTTTEEDGYYYFYVPAGDYEVKEVMQDGWEQVKVEHGWLGQYTQDELLSCEFEVPFVNDGPAFNSISLVILDEEYNYSEYRCNFYNQREDDDDDDDDDNDNDDDNEPRSFSSGTRISRPEPLVLGETVSQCEFLLDHMQMGTSNAPFEVTKLQMFLNIVMGYDQPITGFFGAVTDANVKRFQEQYRDDILDPWYEMGIVPHNNPTGFVYKLTKWKINDIVCPGWDPYPSFDGENLQSNVAIDATPIPD